MFKKIWHCVRLARIFYILVMLSLVVQAQTLEQCQQAAEENYPLIRQYGLIEKTTALTVANRQRSRAM